MFIIQRKNSSKSFFAAYDRSVVCIANTIVRNTNDFVRKLRSLRFLCNCPVLSVRGRDLRAPYIVGRGGKGVASGEEGGGG